MSTFIGEDGPRWGCLPAVLVLVVVGVIGLIIVLSRGGEDVSAVDATPPSTATTQTTTTTTPPTTTTTTTTVPTTSAAVATSAPPSEPVVTVPAEYVEILLGLGISVEEIPDRYENLMPHSPVQLQSGNTPLPQDPRLQIVKYDTFEVTLSQDVVDGMGGRVTGNPTTGGYVVIVVETAGAKKVPDTSYQYGAFMSSDGNLLPPEPGEFDAFNRIPTISRVWFIDQVNGTSTMSAFDTPAFTPFQTAAFGYTSDRFLVFGLPRNELLDQFFLWVQTFGRITPPGQAPSNDDPAGYVITNGHEY